MYSLYHWLELRWMLRFRPVRLFHRLNQLHWYRQALIDWTDTLDIPNGARVLEIGCATGILSRQLARRAVVTAVDRSEPMIVAARRDAGGNNPEFISGDFHSTPLDDRIFNLVIAASLINIVDDPIDTLIAMRKLTASDGMVSVLVPDASITDLQVRKLIASYRMKGFSAEALWSWHRMAPKMERNRLVSQFVTAGIRPLQCKPFLNGFLFSVSGYA